MTTDEALSTLREFQAWRRYKGGPGTDGPDCPDPFEIGEAIDVAIAILNSIVHPNKQPYYGG